MKTIPVSSTADDLTLAGVLRAPAGESSWGLYWADKTGARILALDEQTDE